MWASVECTFQCRTCGFRVPLNGLDMDGAVVCAHCGLEQAFDVGQWRSILEGAHATADLWGDHGASFEGLLGHDYAAIGKGTTSRSVEGSGENRLAAVASPGAPVCSTCHAVVEPRLDTSAKPLLRAVVSCACGATATYETPPAAREMSTVTMVLSSEHRIDRRHVKVDESAAALAVRCPGCDAPLPMQDETKFVTCAYCHLQARIPDRTWFRISKKTPAPEPMWLLFHGPSRARQSLVARQRELDDERQKSARRAEHLAHEREAQAKERLEREQQDAARRASEAALEAAEKERKAQEAKSDRVVAIAVPSVIILFAVGIGLSQTVLKGPPSEVQAATTACNHGDGKACDREGALLASTKPSQAAAAYDMACGLNYPLGCLHAGALAEKSKNAGPAIEDYEKACSSGVGDACSAVEALAASSKVPVTTRLGHYERGCDAGKLDACNSAGTLYATANGDGLAKDPPRAAALYQRACTGGNAAGCKLLSDACKAGMKEACPAHADAGAPHRR